VRSNDRFLCILDGRRRHSSWKAVLGGFYVSCDWAFGSASGSTSYRHVSVSTAPKHRNMGRCRLPRWFTAYPRSAWSAPRQAEKIEGFLVVVRPRDSPLRAGLDVLQRRTSAISTRETAFQFPSTDYSTAGHADTLQRSSARSPSMTQAVEKRAAQRPHGTRRTGTTTVGWDVIRTDPKATSTG